MPIVALTASATSEDEQKCLQAGMTAYLTKPLGRTDLQQALDDALAGSDT